MVGLTTFWPYIQIMGSLVIVAIIVFIIVYLITINDKTEAGL